MATKVEALQDDMIQAQHRLIEAQKRSYDLLLEKHLRLMRHMERCPNVGETSKAKWEDARIRMEQRATDRKQ